MTSQGDKSMELEKIKAERKYIAHELRSADRQRSKRKKISSLPRMRNDPKLKPLPVYSIPYNLTPASKLRCRHQLDLQTETLVSAGFVYENYQPNLENNPGYNLENNTGTIARTIAGTNPATNPATNTGNNSKANPATNPETNSESNHATNPGINPGMNKTHSSTSHISILTTSNIYLININTWTVKSWSTANTSLTDLVVLLQHRAFGIARHEASVIDIERNAVVFNQPSGSISAFTNDTHAIYLAVSVTTSTPSFYIATLRYSTESGALAETVRFECDHAILSLRRAGDNLVGTSHGNMYVWSLDGGCLVELTLAESEALICCAAQTYCANTMIHVMRADVMYTLVLNNRFDDQKLLSDITLPDLETEAFMCGFYVLYLAGETLRMYNIVSEQLALTFKVPGMRIVAVGRDCPVFLMAGHKTIEVLYVDNTSP